MYINMFRFQCVVSALVAKAEDQASVVVLTLRADVDFGQLLGVPHLPIACAVR